MARWRAGLLAGLLLLAGPAWAQVVPGGPSVGGPATEAIPVRCANTTATAFVDCGGGSGTTTISDGAGAGIADVVNATPTTEYGLVVRFPSLPTGANVIGGVTGSGNFTVVQPTGTNLHIVCDSGCGGAATFADEAAFTIGITAINVMGALVDEVTPDSAPEGSAAAPRMSANRVLYSILRDAAGNERGANVDASNRLTVLADQGGAWTLTANAGTNLNTSALALDATLTGRLPAGSTPAENESNAITTTRVGAFLFCFDGTTWDRCPGNSVDGLLVNLGANNDVTVTSGTVTANQGTAAGVAGAWPAKITDGTDTAQVTATGGGSLQVEMVGATAATGQPTNAAQGFVVRQPVSCTGRIAISQTADTQVVTGVAGQRIYICAWLIFANAAETVNIIEGTGTTCATAPTALVGSTTEANGVALPANGGFSMASGQPFVHTGVDANNLCLTQVGTSRVTGFISFIVAAD